MLTHFSKPGHWQHLERLVYRIESEKKRFANSKSLLPFQLPTLSMCRLLIQAGYDVNIKDYDGWTPLHAAAHWGKEEACRILVENLCDMDLINKMVSNKYCRRVLSLNSVQSIF